jgi:tetratricopeptide (TPR) repeat protein
MKRLLFYLLPILFLAACNKGADKAKLSPRDAAFHHADSLENEIRASVKRQENPNVALAMNAIKSYQYFAADFPKDSLSPIYLFRAAQLYEGVLSDHLKAAEIYGEAYDKYPDFPNRPLLMFHQGNAYMEAQDTAHAALYLNKFVITYTDHEFADDAQGLLRMMRMSDQQLQEFLQKGEREGVKPAAEASAKKQ